LRPFCDDEERLPVIPANKLTLSTRSGDGIQDPFGGAADISSSHFRLLANPYYHRSALRRQHRDCELLHALFFLQLLFECAPLKEPDEHPGWSVCCELIKASREQAMLVALGESAYLRARLRHRLKALYSSCGSFKQWNDVLRESGLSESLKLLSLTIHPEPRRKENGISFVSSNRLGGDLYRLPDPDFLLTEEDVSTSESVPAQEAWDSLSKGIPITALSHYPIPQLAEGQILVGASPVLPFNGGIAPNFQPEESVQPGATSSTKNRTLKGWFEHFKHSVLQVYKSIDGYGASTIAQPPQKTSAGPFAAGRISIRRIAAKRIR
jgi:hypothetical protein